MEKQPRFLIQFIGIMVVLLAVLAQGLFHPIKMKPLDGFTNPHRVVELSFKTFHDGSYQRYMNSYTKQHTGFREFFIRNYNQVMYSCFNKVTNNTIQKGYNNELYLTMYLNDIAGKRLFYTYPTVEDAKADARKNVEATVTLIDTLRSHGTEFLFVFCPTKTAVYPEFMPKAYQDNIAEFCLEEYYIELFKEYGINHIDFYHYFQDIKDEFPYPLFAKTGSHWSEATMPFVSDSLYRMIEALTGKRLPSIDYVDPNLSTTYSAIDGELEANLNLLFPLNKPAIPNPIFTLKDTVGKDHPNLLVVGDSFFNQLRRCCFVDAFHQWDYWIYNQEIHSSRPFYQGKQLNMVFDAADIIEDADVVIGMFTSAYLTNYMFGFVPFAMDLLTKGMNSDEENIQQIINNIKNDPAWYKAVQDQAVERGITIEENLRLNATFVYENVKRAQQQSKP